MINFILANLKDKEMLENGLMIYNERIFYRIIDYSIKEVRTNKGLFEKYINMKEIMDIKEIKEMNFDRIKLSISMRVLVILLKLRCYPLIYLCLYIKSKVSKRYI